MRQACLSLAHSALAQPPRRIVGAATQRTLPWLHPDRPARAWVSSIRRAGVVEVGLVKVRIVGVEAAQAVLHCRHDVAAAQSLAVGAVPHAAADLGGQHDLDGGLPRAFIQRPMICSEHAAGVAVDPAVERQRCR